MVQIKCLSNGLYSLKNFHIPFGMGFQPPLLYSGFPFEQHFSYKGASLIDDGTFCMSALKHIYSLIFLEYFCMTVKKRDSTAISRLTGLKLI